ncbi:ATP-binding cassette domain-containing protein [Bacillus capparidis]|uniref:ATPase subunit of ABC transporter with duplicated ATPase domains n=1 Tax=Bacillus capparidis TaxID=1840411 RepID=A0ABS4CV98_9BACI|nr:MULTISPECIES: ATP-binding cassette domain-containing protein [Bacillus]MBP1080999.1 ATPase subunit of ABC transporter with duplicated ATPase domains [Bacillus capparidis]MED1095694.1 ATP-binding cassette domain-containing protein [Bacillus capparidis]
MISVQNISKMYGGSMIFEKVTFEINEYDKVGIVGRNGSGKTTLLKLLTGEESLDEGAIYMKKGSIVGYLQQEGNFNNNSTVFDALMKSFHKLQAIANQMKLLETEMAVSKNIEVLLKQYGELQEEFSRDGGYEMESRVQAVADGLKITDLLRILFTS